MNVQNKPKLIRGATGDWEVVIGLEVHAQVASNAKLFSGASTEFGGAPNSHVSLVDAAMPGMLPVINEECVRQAIRTGLGLKAKINLKSVFDRKNYFYPDLPQGYQISQYKQPIVGEGVVAVDMPDGAITVGIERLHLEQDAGKSIHDQHPSMSLVDLNRSGVALMEIVTKPDLRSAEDAKAFLAKLRSILRYLGSCDGDMEKGHLRADVNVSVRKPGSPLGTRCEIKNVNSIRFIGQAIEHEARRQVDLIEDGGTVEQETRLFDPGKGETRSMRSKEEAHDYRYFPDPDLLPLEFDQAYVDELEKNLPKLPDEIATEIIGQHNLPLSIVQELVAEKDTVQLFEYYVTRGIPAKTAANWTINISRPAGVKTSEAIGPTGYSGYLGPSGHTENPPTWVRITGYTGPAANVAIMDMMVRGELSHTMAKDLHDKVSARGPTNDPALVKQIADEEGMKQVTDVGAIQKVIDDIIANNPDKVADAKANPKAIGWFVGQVMKSSGGKANPQVVNESLKKKLFEDRERIRKEPLQPGERLFDFYDQSGRNGYDEFRSILNTWLSEIDDSHQVEFVSRMRHGANTAFRSTFCELLVHALLVRLGHNVAVHPDVPESSRHPDFAIVDEQQQVQCYVEVTTVNRTDEEERQSNREAVIYNAINSLELSANCLLGYELVQAGPESPPLGPLLESIRVWASENVDRARTQEVAKRFTVEGWTFEFDLFAGEGAASERGAIGLVNLGGGLIAPHKEIRAALYRKSRWYGAMKAPYIIVVADTKGQIFGSKQVQNALTEAVFGDEQVMFVGEEARRGFGKNGFWVGNNGIQNTHVSAVLLMPDAEIWRLREKRRQPLLAINPWSKFPVPKTFKSLSHFEADNERWVLHEGRLFADILELPDPWPPTD